MSYLISEKHAKVIREALTRYIVDTRQELSEKLIPRETQRVATAEMEEAFKAIHVPFDIGDRIDNSVFSNDHD